MTAFAAQRGSILLDDAEIVAHSAFPAEQYVLRVRAPGAARRAMPGQFAHVRCDPSVRLRRPLSIMRASADGGWLEFLYKPRGQGLGKLAQRKPGERLSLLAPIGNGFSVDPDRPRLIALGGGVGIPPMIFLAERMRAPTGYNTVVFMGSEVPFPFPLVPARDTLPGIPAAASAAVALLTEWGVPSRLASNAGLGGCFRGHVTELARAYLSELSPSERAATQAFGCGPLPMLEATAKLARDFGLPCQLAVEEFMACGVGGCAGCNIRIETPDGPAMRRVCVDGPVFDARAVFPG